jgi:hypothetical protein
MEPADLKPTPPDDGPIEAWLKAHATLAPLPDDGFSARVLAALPPPATPRKSRRRFALCLAGALAGFGWAWVKGVDTTGFSAGVDRLDQNIIALVIQLLDPRLGLALVITGFSLLAAHERLVRRRLGL